MNLRSQILTKTLIWMAVFAIAGALTGCSSSMMSQRQFDTPEAAASALLTAVNNGDSKELAAIFGKDNSEIYSSGDEVQDQAGRKMFSELYAEQSRIESSENEEKTLLLGREEWPFPVPLASTDKGKWYFNGEEGVEEITNRRIGKNELTAIQVCQEIAAAQKKYYELDPDKDGVKEYAKKVLSTPGTRDGLFWARQRGEQPSPIGPLVATAVAEGYQQGSSPKPYHGYYFRVLTEKDNKSLLSPAGKLTQGFALFAYPAKWGVSGVMSFLVSEDGVVLQRDLGADTAETAASLTSFSSGGDWARVETSAEQG